MGGVGERSHSILDYISDIKFQWFSAVWKLIEKYFHQVSDNISVIEMEYCRTPRQLRQAYVLEIIYAFKLDKTVYSSPCWFGLKSRRCMFKRVSINIDTLGKHSTLNQTKRWTLLQSTIILKLVNILLYLFIRIFVDVYTYLNINVLVQRFNTVCIDLDWS